MIIRSLILIAAALVLQAAEPPKGGVNDVNGTETVLLKTSPAAAAILLAQNGVAARSTPVYGFMATVKPADPAADSAVVSVRLLMMDGSQIVKTVFLTSRTGQYLSGLALTDSEPDKPLSITIDETTIRRRATL
jgi:hypothetical protein